MQKGPCPSAFFKALEGEMQELLKKWRYAAVFIWHP
jgi:hypothetical protein